VNYDTLRILYPRFHSHSLPILFAIFTNLIAEKRAEQLQWLEGNSAPAAIGCPLWVISGQTFRGQNSALCALVQ
jgi:hypothetical protein